MYRWLELDPADRLPAAADAYERGISLSGCSKATGGPGLRIGWVATGDAAREAGWGRAACGLVLVLRPPVHPAPVGPPDAPWGVQVACSTPWPCTATCSAPAYPGARRLHLVLLPQTAPRLNVTPDGLALHLQCWAASWS